ncbi:endolytic transglycosylase MltG [Yimella sp. cx-573]|nr:endolytic transglycosylase MltG [Yimella sp. cx-573]
MNDSRLSDSIFGGGEEPGEPVRRLPGQRPKPAQTRAQVRQQRPADSGGGDGPSPVQRNRRSCLVMLLAAVLVLGGVGLAVGTLGSSLLPSFGGGSDEGGDFTGEGSGTVDVQVKPGDSGAAIGRALEKAGVVKSANTFARVAGSNPDFAKIQPGTYELKRTMSSQAALNLLLDPDSRVSAGVTIREGLWQNEIFAILSKQTGTPLEDYKKVDPKTLGLPPAAQGKLEGFLFPSTYEFAPKTSAADQLKAMVSYGVKQMNTLGVSADKLRHVVIVASIVQSESRLGPDGPKVARVVENRLKDRMPLGMDSSIHYITQKRGTVTTTDQERNSSSPYNTYRNQGLPPGPISNPGMEALKAAANPAPGPWLYFVTVNQSTGETKFSTSLAEHNRYVAQFQAWCRANPGKC